MCQHSEEGNTTCLGIYSNKVRLFPPSKKVPHMGWNNFSTIKSSLFRTLEFTDDMYYVHSYYAEINEFTIATCSYIEPFSAALPNNNFYATQFHPEKSADKGEKILKNFLEL